MTLTTVSTTVLYCDGAESYYGHLNVEFNAPHPNIYIFVEVLLRQQIATYVTVSSLSKSRTIPRSIREKSARKSPQFCVANISFFLLKHTVTVVTDAHVLQTFYTTWVRGVTYQKSTLRTKTSRGLLG